jgi:hypothetical protein
MSIYERTEKRLTNVCINERGKIRVLSLSDAVIEGNKILLKLPKPIEPELEDVGKGTMLHVHL